MKAQVGFSQRIRLEWLEMTADLALAGNDRGTVRKSLDELLLDKVSVGGHAPRCNREKVVTILMRTWIDVPRGLEEMRNAGLALLREAQHRDRIAVHWGMTLAAYPFWGAVAAHTGRLLRLQGAAAAVHVQRRIREGYGERPTVRRAVQRILRSFIDWGVLRDTSAKGVYARGTQRSVEDAELAAWLAEAVLRASDTGFGGTGAVVAAAARELADHPSIFPFRLARPTAERMVSLSPRLDLLRHGLDDDLVMLREQTPPRGRAMRGRKR